ncbi:MAG: hypothetical protein ACKPKO_54440 [Candidatus Fonsibacter sp.]
MRERGKQPWMAREAATVAARTGITSAIERKANLKLAARMDKMKNKKVKGKTNANKTPVLQLGLTSPQPLKGRPT